MEETNKIENFVNIKNEIRDISDDENCHNSYTQVFIKEEKADEYYENDNNEADTENEEEPNLEDEDNNAKKKYTCKFQNCNAQFLRPSRLLRHIRQHTGERPYKCNFKGCDKAYTNSSHLKRHLETHSNTKQTFTCPHCPKTLSFLHNLKRHCERMHSENSDRMVCKDCGKRFKKMHSYQEHLAAHANSAVTYKCTQCDLSFTSHSKLQRHKKCHMNSGFKCKLCKLIFEIRVDYNDHLKSVHTNDHVCDICNKSFIRKSYLEKHRITHSTENMFSCHYENCYRIYYFKRNLDNHIRTSHLGRKFTCNDCNMQYMSKGRLKLHILKIHLGIDVEPKKIRIKKKSKISTKKGVPTKSMVSRLIGVELPHDAEKKILSRTSIITMIKTEPNF